MAKRKRSEHYVNNKEFLAALIKLREDREIAEILQLPPIKLHCSVLAEDSIKKAIEDWETKKEHRKHNGPPD